MGGTGAQGRSGALGGPEQPAVATASVIDHWESAEDISFQRNRAEIQAKCTSKITRLATWVKAHPLVIVVLDPHRDQPSSVTGETDSRIYDRRVRSVRDALVTAGVPAQRIHTGPLGERQVLCHQATAECQELNRRVEVLLGTPRVSAELR
jgi:outer membrane protein OmpA-like peptidoglycan-associated protein